MFGLKPKLPVTDDERNWVDDGLDQLSRMHGRTRMLYCKVVEPTDGFFPDAFDASEAALEKLFAVSAVT
jgi:hypothetical protein